MARVTLDTFDRFAARSSLPLPAVRDIVVDTVHRFRDIWEHHSAVGMLSREQRTAIEAHLANLPLQRLTAG
jgi:hypothetical protein